jgi:hypothetical protein
MFTVNPWVSRIGLTVSALALTLNLSVAHSVPFASGLVVTGDNDLDTLFTFNGSGTLDVTAGGTSSSSAYPGVSSTDDSLTDIGDGVGFTGTASATGGTPTAPDEFAIGIDTVMSLTNTSASDIYAVTFRLSWSNYVNADGADAFADSELTLGSNGGFDDVFFNDLASDIPFGDEIAGIPTGNAGDPLSDSGDFLFSFLLNPTDVLDLELSWTLEGADFAGGLAEADLSAFLSIESVDVRAPLPGTLFLVGIGMILLPLQRRLRAHMQR